MSPATTGGVGGTRVAIVTGGANGIGRATAARLVEAGLDVAIADREADTAAQVAADLAGGERRVLAVELDVAQSRQCADVVARVERDLGRVDVLVNCAGSFVAQGVDATDEDWDRILSVNVRGCAAMVQAVAEPMRRADGGAIVNVSSVSGYVAQPSRWTYCSSKAAILELTRCQALDLAPFGIRVNSVSPGWIWTREVARAAGGDRARWEPVWGRYAILGRLGEPAEVAEAIEFLVSPRASFVTGTDLAVDGGYLALGPERDGGDSMFAGDH